MSLLDQERHFTTGTEALSRDAEATIDEKTLYLSTDRDDLSLTLEEAAALLLFLRDQSHYPEVEARLDRIHHYVQTGEISKLALYQLLTEISILFLPRDLLQKVQDILEVLVNKGTQLHA